MSAAELPLPHDDFAEEATVGSIFLDPDCVMFVASWLEPTHFYNYRLGLIYKAQLAVADQRKRPTLPNVAIALQEAGDLDKIGGMAALARLPDCIPVSTDVQNYAEAVKRMWEKRQQIQVLQKALAMAYNESSPSEVNEYVENGILALDKVKTDADFVPMSTIMDEEFKHIQRIQDSSGAMSGVPSGFRDLDDLTGGFQKSDLIIVAARPAVGKTSLAMAFAQNAALDHGKKVGVVSLEMSKNQLGQRLLAMHTGIDTKRYRLADIRDTEISTTIDAMSVLSTLGIYVLDAPALNIMQIRSKARRLQATHGLDMLILDYLQLAAGDRKKNDSRVQEVGQISRGLKALARELNIPVIALSQLSRAVESRTSHVPMLSDLRESGDIEQDSDIVMFIYRDELYDPDTDKKGIAELHVAKHRNGPVATVALRFFNNTTRFADLARYEVPEGYGAPAVQPPTIPDDEEYLL